MFTHHDVDDAVLDAGGEYLLFVKDNQETLHTDIVATFDGVESFSPYQQQWRNDVQTATTRGKGHGRVEVRTLRAPHGSTSTGRTGRAWVRCFGWNESGG